MLRNMESVRWAFNTRFWSPTKSDWMLALSYIQPEEKERIGKFVFRKDGKSSLAGRLMLRKLATEKLGLPWAEARFARTDKGRPYLSTAVGEELRKVDFNVSHQGDWVVLAAEDGKKVGVDVMKVEYTGGKDVQDFFHTMRRQFTEQEWTQIRNFSEEYDQLTSFYRHWCLKEGLVKALGVGIGFELRRVSFILKTPVLKPNSITRDTTVMIDGKLDRKWSFLETMLDKKHSVAIALNSEESDEPAREVQSPLFSCLSFDELIASGEALTQADEEAAEAFIGKEESPWT